MQVKDILMENMVLQAKKGIEIQEGNGITFRNVNIISDETEPVVDIIQSSGLVFDKFNFKKGASLLFRVSGDRSKDIQIKNTDATSAGQKIQYELGASEKSVSLK